MAESAPSKDTQEEKPQLISILNQYNTIIDPSQLNLDVLWPKSNEDPKGKVSLKSKKVTKDKGTGESEEKPICTNYDCISEPTQQNLGTISSAQTYSPVQYPKERQKLQLESLKCWCCCEELNRNFGFKEDKCIMELEECKYMCSKYVCPYVTSQWNCSIIHHTPISLPFQCPEAGQKMQLESLKCGSYCDALNMNFSFKENKCITKESEECKYIYTGCEFMMKPCPSNNKSIRRRRSASKPKEGQVSRDPREDTQEEEPQSNSLRDQGVTIEQPELREKQRAKIIEDLKGSVMLDCTKITCPGESEEQAIYPKYNCTSEPTRRNCSAISYTETYDLVPFLKEKQEQRKSLKCRRKSTEDPENLHLCCSPKVQEDEDLTESEDELLAPMKQLLSAAKHKKKNPNKKAVIVFESFPEAPRTSKELAEMVMGCVACILSLQNVTRVLLCLSSTEDEQHRSLAEQSSQGWVTVLGALVVVVVLGCLVMWWRRGRREEQRSSKEAIRMEEGQGKRREANGDTPGM